MNIKEIFPNKCAHCKRYDENELANTCPKRISSTLPYADGSCEEFTRSIKKINADILLFKKYPGWFKDIDLQKLDQQYKIFEETGVLI